MTSEGLSTLAPLSDPGPPVADGDDPAQRLGQLSDAQLDVLALVAEHRSSKEIARLLGISQHTVDQRMKRVQAIMGVGSRFDAARIWSANANPEQRAAPPVWGDLMYQPSALVGDRLVGEKRTSGSQFRPDPEALSVHQTQAIYGGRNEQASWFASLLETGSANELSSFARTIVIVLLTLGAVLTLAAVVSLAEGLSRLV